MLGRVRWRFRTSRSVIEFDNCTRWRTPKEYETQSNIIILRRLLLQVYKWYLRTLLSHSLPLSRTLCRAHILSIHRDRRRRQVRRCSHRRIDWQTRYCGSGGVGMLTAGTSTHTSIITIIYEMRAVNAERW